MEKSVISNLSKTFIFVGAALFMVGCSTYSIPGGQLLSQQKDMTCTDKKTGRPVPGCLTDGKVVTKPTKESLRLDSRKTQPPMRKTVIKANKMPVLATNTPMPTIGVVASEAKIPRPISSTITKPMIVTPPAPTITPAAKVSVLPKPKPVTMPRETTRRLTLSGSTSFKTGSSSLSQAGKDQLAGLARTLMNPSTKVSRLLIEGHTDSTGAAALNQVLSLKRANEVADYLTSQGLIRSSMETVGHGESSPIADNATKAGRAQNRRVEITATGTRQTNR